MSPPLYGVMAAFGTPDALLAAVRALRERQIGPLEAYTPASVEGLADALGCRRSRLPLLALLGGVAGGAGGYLMQWYSAVIAYPIHVGGRPLHSWPLFIPVTFELTILGAVLATVVGMLAANGLPRLRHPIFGAPGFDLATRDRYFLCVRCRRGAGLGPAREALASLAPLSIVEVPA